MKNAFCRLALIFSVFCLPGCQSLAFEVVNIPTYFEDISVQHDIIFSKDPLLKLDIYKPASINNAKLDVIVFFYGGRWSYGSKEDYRFVGTALARNNFIVIIPDYRKYPEVRFPDFIKDGARALAWTYDNIASYQGDPTRIHTLGHSAGAHIGSLLATDAHFLAEEGKLRSHVIYDFVGLAGPYDFTPDEPDLIAIFAPPSQYVRLRATTYVDGLQPPMLLITGANDTTVKFSNFERLEQKIKSKGGCEASIHYPDVDHIGLIGALSWYNPYGITLLDDLVFYYRQSTHGNCSKGLSRGLVP